MLMNQFSADTIKRWQTFLIQQGLLEANGADGHFGPNTTAASKAYQIKKGLNPATTDIEATLRAAREDGFEMPAPSATAFLDVVFDISHHQKGVMDFEKAKTEAGMLGVFHKATEGIVGGPVPADAYYSSRKTQAKAAGLLWGAYHFGRQGNAAAQADYFIDIIGLNGDVLPVLDLEQRTDPHNPRVPLPSMLLEDAATFINRFKEKTGKYPGLYGGSLLKQYMISGNAGQTEVLRQCWLWLAEYGSHAVLPHGWDKWTFWQYSDGNTPTPNIPAPVPGIGPVDREYFNGNPDELSAFWAAQSV
jgi:lysozyme